MKMMKKELFLLLLIIGISSVSCISTKDLTYLQNKNQDSLSVNVHSIATKPYRVQVNDILSINIKALDQKLVDIGVMPSLERCCRVRFPVYLCGMLVYECHPSRSATAT